MHRCDADLGCTTFYLSSETERFNPKARIERRQYVQIDVNHSITIVTTYVILGHRGLVPLLVGDLLLGGRQLFKVLMPQRGGED